jgi:outer membrane lipoprotein carrier protein
MVEPSMNAFAVANRTGTLALFGILALAALQVAGAAKTGRDDLQRFFKDVQSFTAQFNQVVLDESLNMLQESSGTLWIQRPNRFRWNYVAPFEQQIVGDGNKIWVYDVELRQVTVRRMSGGLGNTPAILLAGRGTLDDDFEVKSLGTQGKLDWLQLTPRSKDGGFEDIRVGFDKGKIRVLEMIDGFGQTTRIALRNAAENVDISPERFVFKVPPGVDVVRERGASRR